MTTVIHGDPFTININNTLVGAQAIFDDCEGQKDPLDLWPWTWHNGIGNEEDSRWSEGRRTPADSDIPTAGVALPYARATKYLCGAQQSIGAPFGGVYASQVAVQWRFTRPSFPFYINASWWERCDPRWHFETFSTTDSSKDNNFKWAGYTSQPFNTTPGPNWYLCAHLNTDGFNDATSNVRSAANDDASSNAFFSYDGSFGPNPCSGWNHRFLKLKMNSSSAGYCRGYINRSGSTPVQDLNVTGVTDQYSGTDRGFIIGHYTRNYPYSNSWRYFKDLSLDIQPTDDGELFLHNNTTLLTSTLIALQPRTSRTSTTSTHTCNGGALADGTVYGTWRSSVNGDTDLGPFTLGAGGGGGGGSEGAATQHHLQNLGVY